MRQRFFPVALFGLLFFGCVFGAFAWFNYPSADRSAQDPGSQRHFWLAARTNISGFTFISEPVSAEVQRVLGTTNILSGRFHSSSDLGQKPADVKVFFATWSKKDGSRMALLDHTPEICWASSGWNIVNAGTQPEIHVRIGPHHVPFESRIFEWPVGGRRELVAWCSFVDGRKFDDVPPWEVTAQGSNTHYDSIPYRLRRCRQWWQIVSDRLPVRGGKQFARFSVDVSDHITSPSEIMEDFGRQWLEAR
jgi:hypothetical protein